MGLLKGGLRIVESPEQFFTTKLPVVGWFINSIFPSKLKYPSASQLETELEIEVMSQLVAQ